MRRIVGRPAKKGERPGGRAKGTPNKATRDVRAAIALIAERHIESLETWFTRVARKKPGYAIDLFLRMIEYHIPKLGRVEVTGRDGGALEVRIVRFSDPTAEQLDPAPLSAAGVAGARTGNPPRSPGVAPPKR